MATAQAQSNNLADEIKKLEQQLAEKTALLNKQQVEKIDLLITNFVNEVEKNGFNKVEVKKQLCKNSRVSTSHVSEIFLFLRQKGSLSPFVGP